jgi:dTDP-4-dehydrorhamnose 3,5-epimerase
MQIIETKLPEVKQLNLSIHRDDRGFFCERFRHEWLDALGLDTPFVQQNHSYSNPNVLRGIHLQHSPAQGKLVGVTRGKILDIAVDLRPNSPRYKQYVAIELSGENGQMLWIPHGFGHAFCVLGDAPADVVYQVDAYYEAKGELGIHYADADIGIDWPHHSPSISARDEALPSLKESADILRDVNALYK